MMFKVTLSKVIFSLCIFNIVSAEPDKEKLKILEKFIESPFFDLIKDVKVWSNNKVIKLSTRFESNPSNWMNVLENTGDITDVATQSLCCMYSEKFIEFIIAIDLALKNCEGALYKNLMRSNNDCIDSFNSCTSAIKNIHNSNKKTINDIYLKLINFSKVFQSRIGVDFFNAITTINFYMSVDNIYEPINAINDQITLVVAQMIEKLRRLNIGIIKKLEKFSILSCSQPVFDVVQTKIHIEKKCYGNTDSLDVVLCLGSYVNENIFSDIEISPRLDLDIITPYSKFYEPQNLTLSNLLGLKLNSDDESIYIKDLNVSWKGQETNIEKVSLNLLSQYSSESLIQHHLLMIDSVVSVIFYLIYFIVNHKDTEIMSNKESLQQIMNAFDILNKFNFHEPLNSIFKGIIYTNIYYSKNNEKNIFNLLYMHLEKSHITLENLQHVFNGKSQIELFATLNDLIEKISIEKQSIMTGIDVVKLLTDSNMQESGFYLLVSKTITQSIDFEKYKVLNCSFADTLKKNILWNNFILAQCEDLAKTSSDNELTPSMLIECLNIVGRSIQNFTEKMKTLFAEILNFDKSYNFKIHLNSKIISLYYSLTLLVNNRDFLDIINISPYKPMSYVLTKIGILRRYHLLIINFAEQFFVEHCILNVADTEELKYIKRKINETCNRRLNHIEMAKCIEGLMLENSNANNTLSQRNNTLDDSITWYSINYLMLGFIVNESETDNQFSSISSLKTLWVDGVRTFGNIQNLLRNYIEPRYLIKYQLFVIKSIMFIVYENMKNILVDVKTAKTTSINEDLQNNIHRSLKLLSQLNTPRSINIRFNVIAQLFYNHIQNIDGENNIDDIVKIIEMEQSLLKITNKSNVACLSSVSIRGVSASLEDNSNWFEESTFSETDKKWLEKYYSSYLFDNETSEYDNNLGPLQRFEIFYNNLLNIFDDLNVVLFLLESEQVFNFII